MSGSVAESSNLNIFSKLLNRQEQLPRNLLVQLQGLETFFAPIGGLEGYHDLFMSLRQASSMPTAQLSDAPTISCGRSEAMLLRLSEFCEIYPVGGAGERLGLTSPEGLPLPVASLPFRGLTLLEHLIRDCEGREEASYRLTGQRVRVPIVLMVSDDAQNGRFIRELCKQKKWFGRGRENFFFVAQPLVPVLTEDGTWLTKEDGTLEAKPCGHGVLWMLMEQAGAFTWLQERGCKYGLVRQINNPLVSVDRALIDFVSYGLEQKKSFGFLGCPSEEGMAEGSLVMAEQDGLKTHINIEYSDLKKTGLKLGCKVANTNTLFVELNAVREASSSNPFPSPLLNLKTPIVINGEKKLSGRLETLMQGLSSGFFCEDAAKTYVAISPRSHVLSVAKRSYIEGASLQETPCQAFLDCQLSNQRLLRQAKASFPEFEPARPNWVFDILPAVGPCFSEIASKLQGLSFVAGSELDFSVTNLSVSGLHVTGSFRIVGKNASCTIRNTRIQNAGLAENSLLALTSGQIERRETCTIWLGEGSQLVLADCELAGAMELAVADYEEAVWEEGGLRRRSLLIPKALALTVDADISAEIWLEHLQTHFLRYRQALIPIIENASLHPQVRIEAQGALQEGIRLGRYRQAEVECYLQPLHLVADVSLF